MPKIDHPNIGDVAKTKYHNGFIVSVDSEDDTAEVSIPGMGNVSAIIFYHCSDDVEERPNGALEGGSAAFAEEDEVIVLEKEGEFKVVGHSDGVKRECGGWTFQITRQHVGDNVDNTWDFVMFSFSEVDENAPLSGTNPKAILTIKIRNGVLAEEDIDLHGTGTVFNGFSYAPGTNIWTINFKSDTSPAVPDYTVGFQGGKVIDNLTNSPVRGIRDGGSYDGTLVMSTFTYFIGVDQFFDLPPLEDMKVITIELFPGFDITFHTLTEPELHICRVPLWRETPRPHALISSSLIRSEVDVETSSVYEIQYDAFDLSGLEAVTDEPVTHLISIQKSTRFNDPPVHVIRTHDIEINDNGNPTVDLSATLNVDPPDKFRYRRNESIALDGNNWGCRVIGVPSFNLTEFLEP